MADAAKNDATRKASCGEDVAYRDVFAAGDILVQFCVVAASEPGPFFWIEAMN